MFSRFLDGNSMLCKGFHCYQEQGWWLVVANMGKTSIFPRFFIGLGMPPLIPKMDALQLWMWKHGWFAAKQVFHQPLLKHPFFQSFSKSLAFLTSPKNACVVNVGDLAVSYPNWRNIGKTSIFPSILIAFARVEQNTGLKTMDVGSTAAPLQVVMCTL